MNLNGWLNLNKPIGWTSAKAVSVIKSLIKANKVGHGGTLDPLASGVLPICINSATKQVESIMENKKSYKFNITFGELRDTGDTDGIILEKNDFIPNENDIKSILNEFIGTIEQTPPIYSAIKINGKRACDLIREGKEVKLEPRKIQIYNIIFSGFVDEKSAEFIVDCGRGCYIRSLAVDISKRLNTLGYVSKLVRTKVGNFSIDSSLDFNKLTIKLIERNLLCL